MTNLRWLRTVERWLTPQALSVALVGFFGPWIPHKTAALTVTGFELSELAKFFPEVQTGAVRLVRFLFLAPLIAVALLLGMWVHAHSSRRAVRVLVTGFAALLALAALPPYESLLVPEYAGQLRLALGGTLLVLLTPLTRPLRGRPRRVPVALLALVGPLGALSQFATLRPLVSALYRQPLGLGWGLVACMAGFGLIAAFAVFGILFPDRSDAALPWSDQGVTHPAIVWKPMMKGTRMDEGKGIVFYGTSWCPDCTMARGVLDQQGIPYQLIDVDEDPAASAYVKQVNRGFRSVPTIVFPDGSILVEPSRSQLIQKLSAET